MLLENFTVLYPLQKCSCDRDLDQMTFIYTLDPYSLKVFQITKK